MVLSSRFLTLRLPSAVTVAGQPRTLTGFPCLRDCLVILTSVSGIVNRKTACGHPLQSVSVQCMGDDETPSAPEASEPDSDIDDTEETEDQSPEDAGDGSTPKKSKKSKKRRSRKHRWILGLSIGGGVIVLVIVAAFVTAHFTSASSFCDTCHEMDPYYATWQASEHSGAECRDCHIPPGTVSYIETKLGSFREIYVHFFGKADAPLTVTREIPNASCFRCHDDPPADPSLPTVTFSHAEHAARTDCITCHVRLVHKTLPPGHLDPGQMSSCFRCHDGSTAPNNCSYCHTAPHEKRGECSSCHNTSGFTSAGGNHPFALTGAHASLTCTQCHVSKPGVANIPGTELAQADPACISCHGDNHKGLTDCAGCHTPTAWTDVDFEHPFTLTGAHATLKCAQCHISKPGGATVAGTNFPAADASCVTCHGDHHNGLTNCASCHTPASWTPANFTHPVVGAHGQATGIACAKCHQNGYGQAYCSCHGGNPPSD